MTDPTAGHASAFFSISVAPAWLIHSDTEADTSWKPSIGIQTMRLGMM